MGIFSVPDPVGGVGSMVGKEVESGERLRLESELRAAEVVARREEELGRARERATQLERQLGEAARRHELTVRSLEQQLQDQERNIQ